MTDESERIPARNRGAALAAIALMLALAAVAGAGFVGWREWRAEQTAVAGESARAQALADAERRLEGRIAALEANEAKRADDTAARLASVESGFARLADQVAGQRPDERLWKLAELSYLLHMADHRARLGGDAEGALLHLGEAANLTRSLEEPAFAPLTTAIDSATAELVRAPVVDAAGVHARLTALRLALESAPTRLPTFGDETDEQTGAAADEESSAPESPPASPAEAVDVFGRLAHEVGRLFDFRRRGDTSEPALLRPDEERHLRMSLALTIEQAQVALLRRDANAYAASLADCDALMRRYLEERDPRVVDARTEFESLRALDLATRLPDIRHVLDTFERVAGPGPREPVEAPSADAPET